MHMVDVLLSYIFSTNPGEYAISVTTSTDTDATVYFMDPTAEYLYGGACIYSVGSYYLEANVPYYMVVCLDLASGDYPAMDVDSITVMVRIEKIG